MEAPLLHLALVGTPNSGKTSLFNALTGSRQKVANYPVVTVEKKTGRVVTPAGRPLDIVDLPGTYSLRARSPGGQRARPSYPEGRGRAHQIEWYADHHIEWWGRRGVGIHCRKHHCCHHCDGERP